MNDILDHQIKIIMATIFRIDKDEIEEGSSPDSIPNWDSLQHMNLIVAFEEEFQVEFTDDEIIEMMNYTKIKNTITEKNNL